MHRVVARVELKCGGCLADRRSKVTTVCHAILRLARALPILFSGETTAVQFFRICQFMYMFILFGHWLGLLWYAAIIKPMEQKESLQELQPWIWLDDRRNATYDDFGLELFPARGASYTIGVRYVCALYWALSVMTNLKSISAHESRQCFAERAEILDPLGERIYTIAVFIIGATCFSVIYGQVSTMLLSPPHSPPHCPPHSPPHPPPHCPLWYPPLLTAPWCVSVMLYSMLRSIRSSRTSTHQDCAITRR